MAELEEPPNIWNMWNECPRDCLINIFSFIDFEDIRNIRLVNKKWNILSYDKRVFSRKDMTDLLVMSACTELKILKIDDFVKPFKREVITLHAHKNPVNVFSYFLS